MRIHHLSFTDAHEGAARGAYRVHRGLQQLGHESLFLVADRRTADPSVRVIKPGRCQSIWSRRTNRWVVQWRTRSLQKGRPPSTFWSLPRSSFRPSNFADLPAPSIYNLHWVANFLDWPTMLPWLAERAPIVWTLRDLNPIQGVWHYRPDEAERTAGRDRVDDEARSLKRSALARIPTGRLALVASSRWMANQIARSELMGRFEVRHIPHSLETDVFVPLDKRLAREALGLGSGNEIWIGFVAGEVQDPRKGLLLLRAALDQVRQKHPVRILTVGRPPARALADQDIHLGQVQHDRILALFYSAVDLFVCPSLQEAFGQTVFEAMSCGTPVVGFDTGGIPDMVRPGVTGWLAAPGDVGGLAAAIEHALSDATELAETSRRCRQVVEAEYGTTIQASRYADYFQDMLGQQKYH